MLTLVGADATPSILKTANLFLSSRGKMSMRNCTITFSVLFSTILLGACSINPAPVDVSRSTPSIVEHLLVETRIAIIEEAKERLRASGKREAIKLANELQCDARYFERFRPTMLDAEAQAFYYRYINVAISMDFLLEASESNNASTTVDLLRMVTNGSASLELTAANNLSRDSIRSFLVTRTFKNLLTDDRLARYCGYYSSVPNFEYPISGSVGINDVIKTFVELNEDHYLKPKKDAPNVYSDKLTFTTTTTGSAAPKVVLSPPTRPLHLTMAALNATASRTDLNILTIGLAFPEREKPAAVATRNKPTPRIGALALPTSFARLNNTSTEDASVAAIQQQRLNLFLERIGSLPLR